jgi:hypothetical protein
LDGNYSHFFYAEEKITLRKRRGKNRVGKEDDLHRLKRNRTFAAAYCTTTQPLKLPTKNANE